MATRLAADTGSTPPPLRIFEFDRRSVLAAVAAGGLALGGAAWLLGWHDAGHSTWVAATALVLVTLVYEIVTDIRRGIGLDVIAALAMAGAIAFGEPLAGNVVALMYSGGQLLEAFAQGRARREMTALLGRVRHTAMRHLPGGLEEVPIESLVPGDRILIRQGEVLPVDGTVAAGLAVLDLAALTGESAPAEHRRGSTVLSGSTNAGSAFDLIVAKPSSESAYASIVRLVESAQQVKAPMVRIADRYALWFLAATVLLTGVAWAMTGDPVRALAVLVVATPCPLILAVPVAVISGLSRSAKRGVLIKDGGALEAMAEVRTIVLDKTGTLTEGRAKLIEIQTFREHSADDVLRMAATIDLASSHVVAEALVGAAHDRHLPLGKPTRVEEDAGTGLEGVVDGFRVTVGSESYVLAKIGGNSGALSVSPHGSVAVAVAIDGKLAGRLVLRDQVRPEANDALARFRSCGITRIVIASGDREDVTHAVGAKLDIDAIRGGLMPADKVATILSERESARVMMVGDGVNDAPALAAADVGVALGVRGAAASSEVADVVLLVDRIDRLADAMAIAKRSRRIARQSALAGIGLSAAAMVFAALGHLPPIEGALLQEVIDVGVIVNALRALGGAPLHRA